MLHITWLILLDPHLLLGHTHYQTKVKGKKGTMSTMLSLTHVKYSMHIITTMETLTTVYSCYGFALSNLFCCVSLSNVIPFRCPREVK